MLVLKRNEEEGVIVWNEKFPQDQMRVSFKKTHDGGYQLAFSGSKSFKIFREELIENDDFKNEK